MSTDTLAPDANETIVQLVLTDLLDSPSQPRDSLPNIAELAANIRAERRIHQPLIVRPLPDGTKQIVFGHRRKYAGMEAGLVTGPCVVRDMTDAEVRSAQMTENIQREAMKALEEARGFRAQIDNDGLSPDELAAAIGKSRSWVYERLSLLDLVPLVRQQLEAGKIDASVAALIARHRTPKFQEKALGYIKGKAWDLEDGGKRSYRQIRELLNERFMLTLSAAIFDPEDEMLLPAAGHCLRCPKLSANAPNFADAADPREERDSPAARQEDRTLEDGDQHTYWQRQHSRLKHGGERVCTDPDCFAEKKKAHLQREAAKLRADGTTVVDGGKARAAVDAQGQVKGAYIAVADVKAELKATLDKKAAKPAVVIIQDPRGGKLIKVYSRADLQTAGVKVKDAAASHQAKQAAERAKREQEREAHMTQARAECARRVDLLTRVRAAAAGRQRSTFELRMAASQALHAVSWWSSAVLCELHGVAAKDQLAKRLDTMRPDQLALLLLDCLIVDNCNEHELQNKPGPLLALAGHYGIKPAPKPEPAAPAKKAKRKPLQTTDADAPDDAGLAEADEAQAAEAEPQA